MFNLFKKDTSLIEHRFKNLLIALPANWKYELEEGDQEACFDPKSQSTLRLHIITAIPPKESSPEEIINSLVADQIYTTTSKEYILTNSDYSEVFESGQNLTLITWRLINNAEYEKVIAVLTYTVLTAEKDSAQEKAIIKLLESSIQNSELYNK